MKKPRGFGKNYFRLSAILAYSVANKLQSQVSSAQEHFYTKITQSETLQEEDSPPCEFFSTVFLQSDKPCHCNAFFKIRIRLVLLLNHFIPRCSYYTVCFAFRRTGIHPPFFSFFI